jgi:serine/threonine-protein kinase
MSSVYEAEHALIRRKVAVKVLRSELSVDGVQVQRFFNEARATSAIRHPNIVEVIDVGRLPDGVPYLVMELLEGESLGDRLERTGTLDIPLAIDFARQAASALEAAHALNVIHRDLKPDNLFLVPDQRLVDRELVKVLDFGIAKLRGDLAAPPFDTLVGAVLGTPPYMSPEQCRGLPEEVDERTDVYALGIILYEMVCGRPPFLADGAGELMMLHMTADPEPPSVSRPELPPDLEDVILHALEKRRGDRFANMAEFGAALAEIATAHGLPEPGSFRRSMPAAVNGGREGGVFDTEPDVSDSPHERAITRALLRQPSPPNSTGSGMVKRPEPDAATALTQSEWREDPVTRQFRAPPPADADADADTDTDAPPARSAALPAGERRARWRLPLLAAAAGTAVVLGAGLAVLAARHPSPARPATETAHSAARSLPDPAVSPAVPAASAATEPPPTAAAAPTAIAPAAPPAASPAAERADPPAAGPARAARPRSEPRPPARARKEPRAETAPARGPAPATALREDPSLYATPQPPAAEPPPPPGAALAPGYLSLDSSPWSDVFLGGRRLGTTPLIRVPLPPGKHLLTLRNPELGASTSYAVEIQSGKTLSRLVGWEQR